MAELEFITISFMDIFVDFTMFFSRLFSHLFIFRLMVDSSEYFVIEK